MKKIILVLCLLMLIPVVSAQMLRVTFLNQDPDPVKSGDVVELRFQIENLREETRENVKVEIVPDYPFSLYENSGVKDLGRIMGREMGVDAVAFKYKLKVDADAADGNHPVLLKMYDGDSEIKYEDKFFVDIEREKIALRPYILSSDLVIGGTSGRFNVEIANIGGWDVEALQLELMPSDDYKLLSTSEYIYIGKLEADDTESEDFLIYVDEDVTDVKIPLKLVYEVNDKEYENMAELNLKLLTKEEAKKVGLVKENYGIYIGIIVVALVIMVFVVRKFRKR